LDNEFFSFQILTSDNPGLTSSITGRLTDTDILLETTDTTAPDYLIPRYDTKAVSVEVDGEEQQNGITAQDFTNTVTYTLTDKVGNVRQYDARLMLGSGWFDLGPAPLQPGATVVNNLKAGVLNNVVPYVVSYEGAGDLKAHFYDSILDIWSEYNVGQPVVTNDYDAVSWGGALWVVYENAGVNFNFSVPPNTWGAAINIPGGTAAGTKDLQIAKNTEDRFFAAWIADPSGAKDIQVWKYDGVGNLLTAPDSVYSYSEMELVAAGGDQLYLACLLEEAPGVIHLFEYDGGAWSGPYVDGPSSPFRDEGIIFKEMFYDSSEQTPVLFAAFPDASGAYSLRALYWDLAGSSGTWSDFHPSGDGISSISLSAAELDGLSLSWDSNKVTAVIGNKVKYFSEGSWMDKGYSFDSFIPGASAVTVFNEDVAIVAYIDNPLTDALFVKVKQ
jgi:hypothetical protein